ncbi:hypothetical protein ACLMJK_004956 [Lecanora helva]
MFGRQRKPGADPSDRVDEQDVGMSNSADVHGEKPTHHMHMPGYNHNGHKVTKGIKPEGESGRAWIHPQHFFRICFKSTSTLSMIVNVLWPFVPPAIAIHFARPEEHLWIFILNYIAMVPTANLIGFAGQELARKLPKVFGVLLETFLGGVVEIVLFMVLIHNSVDNNLVPVIRAAILGSILANLLLCLGFCFFAGGIRPGRTEQEFDEVISEVGSGLLLMAGFGLLIPSAFYHSLDNTIYDPVDIEDRALHISRITAVILFIAFFIYVYFQTRSHHGIYDTVLGQDELRDHDRHKDLKKDKLTLTECIIALAIAITCVSMHAVFLVQNIEYMVNERHIRDAFIGLILIPLVEKAAEHLTAVDEAWDNQMNFALAHILGATTQTAMFNSSLVVIVGWGMGKGMDLNFEVFNIVVLILAIIVIGNFLRDQRSNYLEGAFAILIYVLIGNRSPSIGEFFARLTYHAAAASFYYPDPPQGESNSNGGGGGE